MQSANVGRGNAYLTKSDNSNLTKSIDNTLNYAAATAQPPRNVDSSFNDINLSFNSIIYGNGNLTGHSQNNSSINSNGHSNNF